MLRNGPLLPLCFRRCSLATHPTVTSPAARTLLASDASRNIALPLRERERFSLLTSGGRGGYKTSSSSRVVEDDPKRRPHKVWLDAFPDLQHPLLQQAAEYSRANLLDLESNCLRGFLAFARQEDNDNNNDSNGGTVADHRSSNAAAEERRALSNLLLAQHLLRRIERRRNDSNDGSETLSHYFLEAEQYLSQVIDYASALASKDSLSEFENTKVKLLSSEAHKIMGDLWLHRGRHAQSLMAALDNKDQSHYHRHYRSSKLYLERAVASFEHVISVLREDDDSLSILHRPQHQPVTQREVPMLPDPPASQLFHNIAIALLSLARLPIPPPPSSSSFSSSSPTFCKRSAEQFLIKSLAAASPAAAQLKLSSMQELVALHKEEGNFHEAARWCRHALKELLPFYSPPPSSCSTSFCSSSPAVEREEDKKANGQEKAERKHGESGKTKTDEAVERLYRELEELERQIASS
ncbi:hypothetical protein QOT17_016983 [Balamuthia mandrillaris]